MPPGARGLMLAVMMAALMSSLTSIFNSIASSAPQVSILSYQTSQYYEFVHLDITAVDYFVIS